GAAVGGGAGEAGVLDRSAGVEQEPLGAERIGIVGEHAHRGVERHVAGRAVAVVEGNRRGVDVVDWIPVVALIDQRHALQRLIELHVSRGGVGGVVGNGDRRGDAFARIDHVVEVGVEARGGDGGLGGGGGLVCHYVYPPGVLDPLCVLDCCRRRREQE